MLTALYPSIIIISISLIILLFQLVKRRISGLNFVYLLFFTIYISNLISVTIFPFPVQKFLIETMIEDNLGLKNNFIPFKIFNDAMNMDSLSFGLSIILKQVVGNTILFLPMGFVLPIIFSNMQTKKIIFIGFLTSLSIEIFQGLAGLWIGYNYRAADIDDLIFNMLGTAFGLLIWKLLYKVFKNNNLIVTSNIKNI
ncbi:VanZ family protein [Peribacillus frigoritolerans]|uniref:VanZ family protein n=1 Tax=Peribacillus frigoritolerans TaxID=450367 RepID=UPI001F4FC069|nr:VanZ family protein [Peribacillus frigoritolerans]MCK2019813.1 VanZ family protein [Peribacillus frigoritolerans]